MNQIISFLRLQKIDTRLDQVNVRLKQINILLEDNIAVQKIAKQKNSIKNRIEISTQQLELAEQAVHAQNIKIQQVESNLYSGNVRNPKELQDLQAEISSLKRHYQTLENNQLLIMVSLEIDQKEFELSCLEFDSAESEFFSKNSVLLEERTILSKEIERLYSEKKAAEKSMNSEDLAFYNKLRTQKGGVAVSTITEGSCNSCGATLTPAQVQGVKSSEQTVCCPSCGRMLYAA